MLNRRAAQDIRDWVRSGTKPLIVTGARQVGKTFAVRETVTPLCRQLHLFNFEKQPSLAAIFAHDLHPLEIISKLAIAINRDINLQQDIIFFDEIQACGQALTSLKYFHEDLPAAKIIATGSYIGLMQGFPVGKVATLEMFPLTFSEFLAAILDSGPVFEAYRNSDYSPEAFKIIWPLLLEYFYVGGLPEVVSLWVQKRRVAPVEGLGVVRSRLNELLNHYILDFGKYAERNANHIVGLFNNIPYQLAQNIDSSVIKYKFKHVLPKKKSYAELEGPLLWLEQMRMLHRSFIVKNPALPLIPSESIFKAFVFDMGILATQLNLSYTEIANANFDYKGFVAENFVALELKAAGMKKIHSWQSQGDSEIEFLAPHPSGISIPIEVKSGKRTMAKSLETYRKMYRPPLAIKLVGSSGGTSGELRTLPLYYAERIPGLIATGSFS